MKDPIKIAHRGYSDLYADNNMISFRKAYEEGFDVIEMDVQLNQDNDLVVFHDVYLKDKAVCELTTKQSKENNMLCLKEVFEEFRYTDVVLLLDLKGSKRVAVELVKFLQVDKFPLYRILVCSFNRNHLYTFLCSPLKGEIKLGFSSASVFLDYEYEKLMEDIDIYMCSKDVLNHELVKLLKDMKKAVFVYTCNNMHDLSYVNRFDVDGIVSNIYFP
jgi:glycerophosphoryl diester phosphodiesterase